MVDIRDQAATERGESHSQTDRRVRELRGWFRLRAVRTGRASVFVLEAVRGRSGENWPDGNIAAEINRRERARKQPKKAS